MSVFEKSKKAMAGGTPLTTLDLTQQRFERLTKEHDEKNIQSRAAVEGMAKERAGLVQQHGKLAEKIKALNEDFLKAQATARTEAHKRIAAASVTEADLKAGLVNVREFLAAGKSAEAVEAEAQAAADIELGKVRDIIRGVRADQFKVVLQIREIEERIAAEKLSLGERFYTQLKAMMATLEDAGVSVANISWSHGRTKEAKNDLALVNGGCLFNVLTVTIKNMEEAELLFNDPRIQQKHFPELRAFITEISQLNWAEATLFYTPVEWNGRAPGFWYNYRPAAVVTP